MLKRLLLVLLLLMPLPAFADPGTAAEPISRAAALDPGYGTVVLSVRSELFLDEPLALYFLREGGDIANDVDVVVFRRKQGLLALSNDTTRYRARTYQLRPGTYRLVAHGVDCPKVPAENERCLVDRWGLNGVREVSRPSRGYGEIAPSFEVREGTLTYAGDFALTARNTVEWSQIPYDELDKVRRRFAAMPVGPKPIVPGEYRLRYGLNARSYSDDRGRRY